MEFIQEQGIWILSVFGKVQKLMQDSTLHSTINKKFTLSQFEQTCADYYKNMTAGKMILCPHDEDPADRKSVV